jgi:hypothetical protein
MCNVTDVSALKEDKKSNQHVLTRAGMNSIGGASWKLENVRALAVASIRIEVGDRDQCVEGQALKRDEEGIQRRQDQCRS